MSTYAIGDVQGCYDELQALLALIRFDPSQDRLWFAGDLVNRGHQSLQVLRFIRGLNQAVMVLGNHDLHLLALANGHSYQDHTLHEVLSAPDCQELIDWLRQQPLLYYDATSDFLMTHAGLLPQWGITQAQDYAKEVSTLLQRDDYAQFLIYLYGNYPDQWRPDLTGWDRARFIVNAFTRMRFCTTDGRLDFNYTGKIGSQPNGYFPWFQLPNPALQDTALVFGHWAALAGKTAMPNIFALDTGCAWGGTLTAMRLEDRQRFEVRSSTKKIMG